MTKNDLRSGMVVELRSSQRFLLVDFNDNLYGINEKDFDDFSDEAYGEDLIFKDNNEYMRDCDIMKVYEAKLFYNINNILKDDNLELLWDRNKKTSKIEELPFEKASYKQMTEKLNELIKVVNEMSDKTC